MMVKQEGFAPNTGDWFWAVYAEDGTVNNAGVTDFCVSCHVASTFDYVLFLEESSN